MDGFDPESLKNVAAACPGFQARATARALTRYYNACFKPLGLTAEQFSLLVGIGTDEGATVVGLAEQAGVDPTTLSRNALNLENRKLVCAAGGRGRGGKQLALTSSGHQLLTDAFPVWNAARAKLAEQIGEDKLCTALQAMAELAEAADFPAT